MRRPAALVMSATSVVVLGVAFSHSRSGHGVVALAPAPAGVVQQAPVPSPPRPSLDTRPTVSPQPALTGVPAIGTTTPLAVARRSSPLPVAPRRAAAPVVTKAPPAAPSRSTINGRPADTQYGPVQVQIVVSAHRIVQANAIDYPQGSGRDQEINSNAIPQLDQQALQAQSAQIDGVSGATYTSGGYRQSLQSALDAAHRAGIL